MWRIWAAETIAASAAGADSLKKEETMPRGISLFRRASLVAPAAAIALLGFAAVPAAAGCSKRVVLYNANWCPYCRQVRAILARNDIKYSIRDATTASVQADMLQRFGDTSVPRTLVGGVLVEGVDEARIKQLCR